MSECTNCFSNCIQTHSDRCVKYTGENIETLGIKKGDTLSSVTQAITTFLLSVLDGSAIKYDLDAKNICYIISDNLPTSGEISQKDISNALASAVCSLNTQILELQAFKTTLEGNYSIGCLDGVDGSEGTKFILQATINKLCTAVSDLATLESNLATNYVLINDINAYIANYIGETTAGSGTQKDKMVPYTALEYYGPLNVFDATGAGLGDWAEVYLCNGNNGTPDKRGRIAVGATTGMGGGVFPSATDPAISTNPQYTLFATGGTNVVTLTSAQIPAHTHVATGQTVISPETHNHGFTGSVGTAESNSGGIELVGSSLSTVRVTQEKNVTLTATTLISNASTGGGDSHTNIPPVMACYYIIYIPEPLNITTTSSTTTAFSPTTTTTSTTGGVTTTTTTTTGGLTTTTTTTKAILDYEHTIDYISGGSMFGQLISEWYIIYNTSEATNVKSKIGDLLTIVDGGGTGINRSIICASSYNNLWVADLDPLTEPVLADGSVNVTQTITVCTP